MGQIFLWPNFFRIKFWLTPPNVQRKEIKLVLSRLPSPKQSRKNKTSFEFIFCYKFDSNNKNIKQNIGENIVKCWFYEISIKILRQTPIPTFVKLPLKFWCWFHKTNTVIYYFMYNVCRILIIIFFAMN